MDSILTSVKKSVNVEAEDTHFDSDIIQYINSVFADLQQLGVGPAEGFFIEDSSALWKDFTKDAKEIQSVKSYIGLRVRLLFDPPTNSAVLESMKQQIEKWEWRLNVAADT